MILNDNLVIHKKDNIEYLSFKNLEELGVINAFSLKGLSFNNNSEIYSAYQKILKCLDIDYKSLVKLHAKHTDNIIVINEKVNKDTADINLDYLEEVDGLITDKKGIALATTSADCLCVVLFDPVKHIIANIHSGWRGTFQKIAQKGLKMMKEKFGCNPEDILAFFMPAIRACHFEVEDDVMTKCREIFTYTDRIDEIIKIGRVLDGVQKYNIDNILINEILLEEEGILKQNIYDSGICTVCNSDKMNSYRADGKNFDRSTIITMMK